MMSATSLDELLRAHRDTGVLGLVDDLLVYCRDRQVSLTWERGAAVARPLAGGAEERAAVPFRGSAFRAVLARLAALCDGNVSPYGGGGVFTDPRPPATAFRFDFSNTPDEQRLELVPGRAPVTAPTYAPIDVIAVPLIGWRKIDDRVRELATALGDDRWDEALSFFWVANGAFFFASDLVRAIQFRKKNILIETVRARSYHGTQTGALVHDADRIDYSAHRGRRIVLLDEVLDTGQTLWALRQHILNQLPAARIETVALVHKEGCQRYDIAADHIGFSIGGPDGRSPWLLGAGMDDSGFYRTERSIWAKRIDGWPQKASDVRVTVCGVSLKQWALQRAARNQNPTA